MFIQSTRSMRFFRWALGGVIVFVCLLRGSAAHTVIFSDGARMEVGGTIGLLSTGIIEVNGTI